MLPEQVLNGYTDYQPTDQGGLPLNSPSVKVAINHSQAQDAAIGQDHSQIPNTKKQKWIRLIIFLFCLTFLVLGRLNIPDNNVPAIVDKVMDSLKDANAYVLSHPTLRSALLICCSLSMDIMFLTTGAYWILYGKTSRVIVSTLIFYFIRAGIQQIWYVPYPEGYFWDYPGFPSIVVSYGQSSDFFFSGHIGFVVINASEWVKNKKPWAAGLVALVGVYTAFILVIYRAHYTIDIFGGIVCASWVFIIVDIYKEKIDGFFIMIYLIGRDLIRKITKKTPENDNQTHLLSTSQDRPEIHVM